MFGATTSGFGGFGQQNNAAQQQPGQQQQQPAQTGLFGAQQPAQTQPSTGFGGFGAAPASSAPFGSAGGFGAAPAQTAVGGAQPGPQGFTFGAAAAAGNPGASTAGGGFGQQQQANKPAGFGGFGAAPASNTTFGAPASTGFGAQPQQSALGGFGAKPATATAGFFGQPAQPAGATNAFGANQLQQQQQGGLFGQAPNMDPVPKDGTLNPPYQPYLSQETDANGTTKTTFSHQSITCMPAYKGASLEELRQRDYEQGRKSGNAGAAQAGAVGGFGGFGQASSAAPAAGGLFGSAQQPQSGGLFGAASQQPGQTGTGLFGQSSAAGGGLFGQQQQSGGLFGQPQQPQAGGLFGGQQQQQQQQPGTGTGFSFGSSTTGTGAGTTGSFSFGQPQQQQQPKPGGLFGGGGFGAGAQQQPSAAGFSFGGAAQQQQQPQQGLGGFGATGAGGATSSGFSFGQQQQKPGVGLFGGAAQQQPATSAPGASTTFGGFGSAPGAAAAAKPTFSFGAGGGAGGGFGQPASSGTSLFGQTAAAPTGGLFGQQTSQAGAGGAATAPAATGAFGFGQPTQQQQQQPSTGGGLFGGGGAGTGATGFGTSGFGGGLFGGQAKPAGGAATGGGGLFGTQQQQPQQQPGAGGAGGLFGGFGGASTNATTAGGASAGGGLFGNLGGQAPQQPGQAQPPKPGGLFGGFGATTTSAAQPAGQQQQQQQPGFGGLFGGATQQQQQQPQQQQQQPGVGLGQATGGSLFGGLGGGAGGATTAAGGGGGTGLFGQQQGGAAAGTAGGGLFGTSTAAAGGAGGGGGLFGNLGASTLGGTGGGGASAPGFGGLFGASQVGGGGGGGANLGGALQQPAAGQPGFQPQLTSNPYGTDSIFGASGGAGTLSGPLAAQQQQQQQSLSLPFAVAGARPNGGLSGGLLGGGPRKPAPLIPAFRPAPKTTTAKAMRLRGGTPAGVVPSGFGASLRDGGTPAAREGTPGFGGLGGGGAFGRGGSVGVGAGSYYGAAGGAVGSPVRFSSPAAASGLFKSLSDEQAAAAAQQRVRDGGPVMGAPLPAQAYVSSQRRAPIKRLVLDDVRGGGGGSGGTASPRPSLFGASPRAGSAAPAANLGRASELGASAARGTTVPPRVTFSPALETAAAARRGASQAPAAAERTTLTGGGGVGEGASNGEREGAADLSFASSALDSSPSRAVAAGRRLDAAARTALPALGVSRQQQPSLPSSRANGATATGADDEAGDAHADGARKPSGAAEKLPLGYYTQPPLSELRDWPLSRLAHVEDFVVGRRGVGEVRWLQPVDLSNLHDISEVAGGVVQLRSKEVFVYPDEEDCLDAESGEPLDGVRDGYDARIVDKAKRGRGLNVAARVTLQACWPLDRATRRPLKDADHARVKQHVAKLKRRADAKFVGYDAESGAWSFEVEHFSRYGLDDDDEDDDEEQGGADGGEGGESVGGTSRGDAGAKPSTVAKGKENRRLRGATPLAATLEQEGAASSSSSPSTAHRAPPRPAPPYAAALGLEARRMQVMQASFFGGEPARSDPAAARGTEHGLKGAKQQGYGAGEDDEDDDEYGDRQGPAKMALTRDAFGSVGGGRKHARASVGGVAAQTYRTASRVGFGSPAKAQRAATTEAAATTVVLARASAAAAAAMTASAPAPRKFTRLDLATSAVEGHDGVTLDAGLSLGRSFRAGWGPDGSLVVCGKVVGMRQLMLPRRDTDEANAGAGASSDASLSTVRFERYAVFPAERAAKERERAAKLLQLQLVHSEVAPTSNDSDDEDEDAGEEDSERERGRPPAAVEAPQHEGALDSQQETDAAPDDAADGWATSSSAAASSTSPRPETRSDRCPVAFPRQATRFRDFASAFEAHDHSHEASLWRLAQALFDEVPLRLPPAHETRDTVERVTRLRRKAALSAWLSRAVAPLVEGEARSHQAAGREPERLFALLSGHQLERACASALASGDLRLATLLAQAGGGDDEVQADVAEQLASWRREGVEAHIDAARRRVYTLLAGNVTVAPGHSAAATSVRDPIDRVDDVHVARGLDWKRALGLHLWYGAPHDAPLTAAVERYAAAAASPGAHTAPPLPPYLEERKLGGAAAAKGAEGTTTDALFQLINLFSKPTHPLESTLSPLGFGGAKADYRLPWHLYVMLSRVLRLRDFSDRVELGVEGRSGLVEGNSATADALTRAYAHQLEVQGQWTWAAFVLLHLELETSRREAVKALLARHVPPADEAEERVEERRGTKAASATTTASNAAMAQTTWREQRSFLVHQLCIPRPWLLEAQALRAAQRGDAYGVYRLLLASGDAAGAHRVAVRQLAPEAVIRGDLELVLALFAPLGEAAAAAAAGGKISTLPAAWASGGQVYVDYVACVRQLPYLVARAEVGVGAGGDAVAATTSASGLDEASRAKLVRLSRRVVELAEQVPRLFEAPTATADDKDDGAAAAGSASAVALASSPSSSPSSSLTQMVAKSDMMAALQGLCRLVSRRRLLDDDEAPATTTAGAGATLATPPEIEALQAAANDYCALLLEATA